MKYAINTRLNQTVPASDNISRYVSYVCPTCKKAVHFVSSVNKDTYIRIPHFAHNKGEGSTECEFYCPPNKGTQVNYLGQSKRNPVLKRKKPIFSRHLKIRISDFRWSLEAIIHLTRFTGLIRIEEGFQGTIEKEVEDKSFFKFNLAPNTDYSIEIDDRLTIPLPGLSENQINIFCDNGKHLTQSHKPLYWGSKYFFVWQKKIKKNIPKEILGKELLSLNEWECSEIVFPEQKNASIDQWIFDQLNRSMESLPDQEKITIIFPPENYFDDEHPLILGIYRESFEKPIQGELSITIRDKEIKPIKINQTSPVHINTESSNQSIESMTFNEEMYICPKLDLSKKNLNYPAVFLRTDQVCVEANDLKTIVKNIDTHKLKEIILPAKMPVSFIIDKEDTRMRQITIKPLKNELLENFKKRLLDKIIESLEDVSLSLDLNFENYGLIILLKQRKSKDEILLSNHIKRQIQWLNSMKLQQGWYGKGLPNTVNELKIYLKGHNQMLRPELEPHYRSMLMNFNKNNLKKRC
ncbi:hypothetical protein MHK_010303 [Candidatus Magnetomorum sp. HK-1]|nr:hypothetical protein MHK_010303 [Candidatus Magnetomorum sp. HK-1]